jgi:hypothetical protein
MNVIQLGPSHRVAELARAMAPDPCSREKLDFVKLGFQNNQYEELEALRCKDRRHNGHCNCVHVSYFTILNGPFDIPEDLVLKSVDFS